MIWPCVTHYNKWIFFSILLNILEWPGNSPDLNPICGLSCPLQLLRHLHLHTKAKTTFPMIPPVNSSVVLIITGPPTINLPLKPLFVNSAKPFIIMLLVWFWLYLLSGFLILVFAHAVLYIDWLTFARYLTLLVGLCFGYICLEELFYLHMHPASPSIPDSNNFVK